MSARDRSAKFVELANKRTNRALRDIKLICNLSNRQNYDYTEEQAKKIVRALQQEIDHVKQCFSDTEESPRSEFKL